MSGTASDCREAARRYEGLVDEIILTNVGAVASTLSGVRSERQCGGGLPGGPGYRGGVRQPLSSLTPVDIGEASSTAAASCANRGTVLAEFGMDLDTDIEFTRPRLNRRAALPGAPAAPCRHRRLGRRTARPPRHAQLDDRYRPPTAALTRERRRPSADRNPKRAAAEAPTVRSASGFGPTFRSALDSVKRATELRRPDGPRRFRLEP